MSETTQKKRSCSVQSAKQKGRSFEDTIVKYLQDYFGLDSDDIRRAPASVNGVDIQRISEDARKKIPFSIECKSQATIKVKEWWKQAEKNTEDESSPALIFRVPNTSTILTIINFVDFMELVSKKPKSLNSNTTFNNDILQEIQNLHGKYQQDYVRLLEKYKI